MKPLYLELSSLVDARKYDAFRGNTEWFDKRTARIEALVTEHLPSGSGFDHGTQLDLDASHADQLVFTTAFHHMDDSGFYDQWTHHKVIVKPSFAGINLRVTGRNYRDIKDYIAEAFQSDLNTDLTDQLEYERLEPRYHYSWSSRWKTPCEQVWCVTKPTDQKNVSALVRDGFPSWLAARTFAIQRMNALEDAGSLWDVCPSCDSQRVSTADCVSVCNVCGFGSEVSK